MGYSKGEDQQNAHINLKKEETLNNILFLAHHTQTPAHARKCLLLATVGISCKRGRSLYFQELEQKATEIREQAQQEVASLQDVHQSKMAALKKRHKDEITQLKSQISSFEQQLNDGTCILNIL